MKHVICCGLAGLDLVFYLPEITKTPIKSFATNYHPVGGGNAFVGEFKDGKYWTVIDYDRYGTILGRISKGQLVEGEWE